MSRLQPMLPYVRDKAVVEMFFSEVARYREFRHREVVLSYLAHQYRGLCLMYAAKQSRYYTQWTAPAAKRICACCKHRLAAEIDHNICSVRVLEFTEIAHVEIGEAVQR